MRPGAGRSLRANLGCMGALGLRAHLLDVKLVCVLVAAAGQEVVDLRGRGEGRGKAGRRRGVSARKPRAKQTTQRAGEGRGTRRQPDTSAAQQIRHTGGSKAKAGPEKRAHGRTARAARATARAARGPARCRSRARWRRTCTPSLTRARPPTCEEQRGHGRRGEVERKGGLTSSLLLLRRWRLALPPGCDTPWPHPGASSSVAHYRQP